MLRKWAYQKLIIPHNDLITKCNELGVRGWELTGIIYSVRQGYSDESSYHCIFKRPGDVIERF